MEEFTQNGGEDWGGCDTFISIEEEDEEDDEEDFERDYRLLDDILDGSTEALVESIKTGNTTVLENLQISERNLSDVINGKTKFGKTPLHIAAIKGREDWVHYLTENNAMVDQIDAEGKSALHFAVMTKNSNIVQKLITSFANINCTDFQLRTPLHFACMIGLIDSVQILVTQGAKIMSLDQDLESPLHFACLNSHYYVVRYLLNPFPISDLDDDFTEGEIDCNNKADPNAADTMGRTPIHAAVSNCIGDKIDIVRCLLESGGNVNYPDIYNRTPLFWCIGGHCSPECISLLLDHNANVGIQDNFGRYPLHYASFFSHERVLTTLMDKCSNLEYQDYQGRTPFHFGVHSNEIINFLLQRSKNLVSKRDKDGRTALHFAAMGKFLDSFELLLENASEKEINFVDKYGRSCIHYLAVNNSSEFLEQISRLGGDFNKKDLKGQTPLHYAARYGSLEFIQALKEFERAHKMMSYISSFDNKGRRPLHIAAACGHASICSFLIDNRSYSRIPDKIGACALHYAAYFANNACIDILLRKGKELTTTDKLGRTPLHAAASSRSIECVTLLIDANADLNATDNDGRTPIFYSSTEQIFKLFSSRGLNYQTLDNHGRSMLHSAASLNNTEMIYYILQNNLMSVDSIDNQLVTPLHLAAYYGNVESVKLLIDFNGSCSFVDINIRNPLYYAASSGNLKCVELLAEKSQKNQRDIFGRTALDAACFGGHVNCILYLLEKVDPDNQGRTPLHAAVYNGSKEVCKIFPKLLEFYDINECDFKGRSALHRAVLRNNVYCVEALLQNGAFIDITDNNGFTPLMMASYLKYDDIIDTLSQYNANTELLDHKQRSAADYAELRRQEDKLENPSDDDEEEEEEDEDDEEEEENESSDKSGETKHKNDDDDDDDGDVDDVIINTLAKQPEISLKTINENYQNENINSSSGDNENDKKIEIIVKKKENTKRVSFADNGYSENSKGMKEIGEQNGGPSSASHLQEIQMLKEKVRELEDERSKILEFEREAQSKLQEALREIKELKTLQKLHEEAVRVAEAAPQVQPNDYSKLEKELQNTKELLEDYRVLIENLKKENQALQDKNRLEPDSDSVIVSRSSLSDLKYRYFHSLTLNNKLSLPSNTSVSLDSSTLYQEALRLSIPISDWNNWIWNRITT